MPEVSITLPSLRREAVLRMIKELSMTNGNVDYEIIVVSPFTVKEDRVVHIYEENALGNIHAANVAYENSSGKYIMTWCDDVFPTINCISDMLNFVKNENDPFIGSFKIRYRQGHEHPQFGVYDKLYACYGFCSRDTINLIGGYLDTVYKSHWADPDIALRTWEKGGKVKVCPNAYVIMDHIDDEVTRNNSKKYFDNDKITFLNRWHDKLGKGIDRNLVNNQWNIINKPIFV